MNDNGLRYRLRALRLALGLSQEEVADIIGVSIPTMSLWERGLIDSEYGQAITDALNSIKEKQSKKFGFWYDGFVEAQTAMNEVTVWIELEGHAPTEVIKRAKDMALMFSNL